MSQTFSNNRRFQRDMASARLSTQAAAAETSESSPGLKRAIEEAETAAEAGEHSAPRSLNPEPSHPGAVEPETGLLEGEDHTNAFAGEHFSLWSSMQSICPTSFATCIVRLQASILRHHQQLRA